MPSNSPLDRTSGMATKEPFAEPASASRHSRCDGRIRHYASIFDAMAGAQYSLMQVQEGHSLIRWQRWPSGESAPILIDQYSLT
eukprot:12014109-Karenia_brevis.AAC.1